MNKENLWFITLFSIILILCVYYISIPGNILEQIEPVVENNNDDTISVNDTSNLIGLRVENDEEVLNQIEELQTIIVDNTKRGYGIFITKMLEEGDRIIS